MALLQPKVKHLHQGHVQLNGRFPNLHNLASLALPVGDYSLRDVRCATHSGLGLSANNLQLRKAGGGGGVLTKLPDLSSVSRGNFLWGITEGKVMVMYCRVLHWRLTITKVPTANIAEYIMKQTTGTYNYHVKKYVTTAKWQSWNLRKARLTDSKSE